MENGGNPSISPGGRSRESNKVYVSLGENSSRWLQERCTGALSCRMGQPDWHVRRVIGELQVLGDFPSILRNEM